MKLIGDTESVNLSTGKRQRRVVGDGESRVVPYEHIDHIRLGPHQETEEEVQQRAKKIAAHLVRVAQKENRTMTRCKFHCSSVKKMAYRQDGGTDRMLYEAEFYAVSTGSDENKKFFEWTPSGSLKIGVYKEDLFEPGKDYYLDMSLAGE